MHGLVTGAESRQQLYTMLTRGRAGQPRLPRGRRRRRPAHRDPSRRWSGRSPPPTSSRRSWPATTPSSPRPRMLREQADPGTRLGDAAQRYLDSLYVAAEARRRRAPWPLRLDAAVEELLPGLVDEPAWPALRAHLTAAGRQRGRPGGRAAGGGERPGAGHRRRPRRGAGLAAGRLRDAQHRRRAAAMDAGSPDRRWPSTPNGAAT